MTTKNDKTIGVFPALLKYWRSSKGLSQLDLGLAADVSARHISFLETGRAKPSREMVLTLAATLEVPMREQNTMLSAAGFQAAFEESPLGTGKSGPIDRVIDRMLAKHEPYPMVVMDSGYDLINSNLSAQRLIQRFIANPMAIKQPLNLYEMLFHPELARPFVKDWEALGHQLLSRINRESILRPYNSRLGLLLERLLSFEGVPAEWRVPDFSQSTEPFLTLKLQNNDLELNFLTIITAFSAPQNITAEEILIETLFPVDDATEQACQTLNQQ
ncbi:MAG: helix-turn-helix transcriptional regulator [Pseudomonadales bacterium]|nr:helix-turn-helix transcriptional regulator [Pseudomonadales bacterium]